MDLTVLNLALPALSEDLEPSSSQLLWIVDIYGFLVAGLLITMGTLGDRIGRRRLLLIGAAAFGVASVFAAFSTSAEMLIAARALLGVAGATLAPSTLSLIRNMFDDPQQRTFAIGVWITSFSAGAAIGPLIGGLLLERFWWGSVFLPALPVMGLLLVVGPRLLPEYRDPEAGRLDLISAAPLARRRAGGDLRPQADRPGRRGIDGGPVDRGRPRRRRRVRAPAATAGRSADRPAPLPGARLQRGARRQHVRLLRQLRHRRLHRPVPAARARAVAVRGGLWTVPYAGAFIVGALLTPLFVRRIRPAFVIAGGLALAGAGFALLTQVDGDSALATLVTGSVVFALGLAPVYTLAADLMVGAAPPERAGGGRGDLRDELRVRRCARHRGPRRHRHGRLPRPDGRRGPGGCPTRGGGGRARHARRRGGGGRRAPGPLGAELVERAREAFTQALQLAATLSAAVAIGAAILAAALLRRVRMGSELEEERGLESDPALAGGCGRAESIRSPGSDGGRDERDCPAAPSR